MTTKEKKELYFVHAWFFSLGITAWLPAVPFISHFGNFWWNIWKLFSRHECTQVTVIQCFFLFRVKLFFKYFFPLNRLTIWAIFVRFINYKENRISPPPRPPFAPLCNGPKMKPREQSVRIYTLSATQRQQSADQLQQFKYFRNNSYCDTNRKSNFLSETWSDYI